MGSNLNYDLEGRLLELNQLSKEYPSLQLVFTVGNTRVYGMEEYYLTPIRVGDNFIVSGIIVFSESEAEEVFKTIDGKIKYIFIDCEKKSKINKKGLFNIERLSTEIIKKSECFFFKGNDLTVEAIDNFIFNFFKEKLTLIGGKKILIVGLGNIGFKIALKLLERGGNIFLKSRDRKKELFFSKTLNEVKPKETIAEVKPYNEEIYGSMDVLLLCHTAPLESNTEVLEMNSNLDLILDVGKGCLSDKQIDIISGNTSAFRLDVGDTIIDYIERKLLFKKIIRLPRSVIIDNQRYIEPGLIGRRGDIVVNDIEKRNMTYGVCDGKGGFIKE